MLTLLTRFFSSSFFQTAWELRDAPDKLRRDQQPRTEILRSFSTKECVDGCAGDWGHLAEDILQRNHVNSQAFKDAIYEAIYYMWGMLCQIHS